MINLYSRKTVLDTLEIVLIRDEKKENYKIKTKLNEEIREAIPPKGINKIGCVKDANLDPFLS